MDPSCLAEEFVGQAQLLAQIQTCAAFQWSGRLLGDNRGSLGAKACPCLELGEAGVCGGNSFFKGKEATCSQDTLALQFSGGRALASTRTVVPLPWALGVETMWEWGLQGPGQYGYWASGSGEPLETKRGWVGGRGWENWDTCHLGKPTRRPDPWTPPQGVRRPARGLLEEAGGVPQAAQGVKGTGGCGSSDPGLLPLTSLQSWVLQITSPQPTCKAALAASELLIHGGSGRQGTEGGAGGLGDPVTPLVLRPRSLGGGGRGGGSVLQEHLVQDVARHGRTLPPSRVKEGAESPSGALLHPRGQAQLSGEGGEAQTNLETNRRE